MKNFIEINKTDEEQEQQIKQWIKENTLYIVVGVTLGLGGVWGFDYYQTYQQQQNMQARYHYLSVASNPNNTDALRILKQDYADSTYTQQANLLMAKHFLTQGKAKTALTYLLPLINSTNEFIAQNAKFRAANIYLEINDIDTALSVLGEDDNESLSAFYHHIKGDIHFAQNNINDAKKHYNLALSKLENNSKLGGIIRIKLNDLN